MQKLRDRSASIIVVDTIESSKNMMMSVLGEAGFTNVKGSKSIKDALSLLEVESMDWLICPTFHAEADNIFKLLKLALTEQELKNLRISAIIEESDIELIPFAFELGLLHYFKRQEDAGSFLKEVNDFIKKSETLSWNETKLSASYLSDFLFKADRLEEYVNLQQSMFDSFGELVYIFSQVEPLLRLDQMEKAKMLFKVAELSGATEEELKSYAEELLGEKNYQIGKISLKEHLNAGRFVIICPQEKTTQTIIQTLKELDVTDTVAFKDSIKAWEYIESGEKIDVIVLDWSTKGLSGVMISQRIKNLLPALPVVILEFGTTAADHILLKEIGVSAFIMPPIEKKTFAFEILGVLQKEVLPREGIELEASIRKHLEAGEESEAKNLWVKFSKSTQVSQSQKKRVQAEMEYHVGNFELARDLIVASIVSGSGESISAVSLLGKCFLALGQHDAALKCFEKAQALSPNNISRLCMIAETNAASGKSDAADESLAKAKSIDAGSQAVKNSEAAMAVESGNIDKAKEMLKDTKLLRSLIAKLNNKAVAFVKAGNHEKAKELYDQTLASIPDGDQKFKFIVNYNYGLFFARINQLDKAIVKMAEASAAQPPLGEKAKLLVKQFEKIKATGGQIKFKEQIANKKMTKIALDLLQSVEIDAGQKGLFRVFKARDEGREQFNELISQSLHFKSRR